MRRFIFPTLFAFLFTMLHSENCHSQLNIRTGKAQGNALNWIPTGNIGGMLAHGQTGGIGGLGPNDTWMWMGRPLNLSREEYGLRIQDEQHLAKFSLVGGGNVKTLDLLWGGSATSNLNFFFTPNGTLDNRRLIARIRPNGFFESFNRQRAYANFNNSAEYLEMHHDGGVGYINSQGDGELVFRHDSQTKMRLTDAGVLAINRNAVNFNLDVGGNARNATGTWTTSDERFKKNIQALPKVVDQIMKLQGCVYEFKNEKIGSVDLTNDDGRQHFGFIAQDVEQVFPELVLWDDEGYCALRYEGLIPVLVEGFKEQQVMIENRDTRLRLLDDTVAEQKKTIKQLDRRVKGLEDQLQALIGVVDSLQAASAR